MDGLTISNSNALLEQGQTLKQINQERLAPQVGATSIDKAEKTFSATLKDAVNQVNALQRKSSLPERQKTLPR
jgi:flagellar hook-basal body complex protein FliE